MFVAIGILLSLGLPRLFRGSRYTLSFTNEAGQHGSLDVPDASGDQWRSREGITNAVNLPALVITGPLQFAIWRGGIPFQYRVPFLVWSAIIIGIPFWWLLGKFLEQAFAMFKRQPFEAPTKADWAFALICSLAGGLAASAWFSGPNDLKDLLEFAVGGTFWVIVGVFALLIRLLS